MCFKANGAVLLLVGVLVPATSAAQQEVQSQEGLADGQRASRVDASPNENLSRSLLLNPSEGLSVIGAALESRGRSRSDCSHLVHAIYQRAGFPYSYVSSSDLYAGVHEFQRVARPQPGDLVVWRGHVGIMVNPSEKTFYSALRSGRGVESYSSSYWKQRGTPRFYRYLKAAATDERERTAETASSTRSALDDSVSTETRSSISMNPVNFNLPRVLVIDSALPRPDEVTQALLLTLNINPEGLREADVLKLARSLIIFSRLEVRAVKIHGDEGRAEVRITEPFTVADGQARLRKGRKYGRGPSDGVIRKIGNCCCHRTPFTCPRTPRCESWRTGLRYWQTQKTRQQIFERSRNWHTRLIQFL